EGILQSKKARGGAERSAMGGDNSGAGPNWFAGPRPPPAVLSLPRIEALAMPTPIIEPIKVCEEEAGRPRYQVPRFQMIAANSRANTMAKPACEPTWRNQFDRQQRDDRECDG